MAVERAGVPAVTIVAEGFRVQAEALAPLYGISRSRNVYYQGVIMNDSASELRGKVRDQLVPEIISGLASPVELVPPARAFEPERIVVSGELDDVLDRFHAEGWTDGLPVVPPTLDRVRRFLEHTDRDPHQPLGVMPPAEHEITPWTVAVNAVMAGCKPEYMPVLVAVAEAASAPEFRVMDGGASPGWEPLVILSGPMADQLGFNSGQGVLRVGNRANTSVGRFLRMLFRNVAGLRPGGTDKATFGYTFNCVLAENDEAVTGIGWEPHRVERGFAVSDTVVTLQSVVAFSAPVLPAGPASTQLSQIGEVFRDTTRYWYAREGMFFGRWSPLVALSPSVARVLAEAGVTKADIAGYLASGVFSVDGERLSLRASEAERIMAEGVSRPMRLEDLVERGVLPDSFVASDDPDRVVPLLLDPSLLHVVVTGDPFRNQAKVFVQNHKHGLPTTRRVDPT